MGAVSYGQGGYVGASMSVRAQAAYESGEMPMSKWTRSAIISAIKDYCADFDLAYDQKIETMSRAKLADTYLEYKSWHHTGRFARVAELFDERGLDDLIEAKRDEAELSEDLGLVRESDCR